jgi:hypothetical protein
MNAMYNMRLPASESAKLVSARTGERLREYEDAVRARAAEDDVVTAHRGSRDQPTTCPASPGREPRRPRWQHTTPLTACS